MKGTSETTGLPESVQQEAVYKPRIAALLKSVAPCPAVAMDTDKG